MVGYDLNDSSVFNYIMDTQNLWAVYNMVPVLALDVYGRARLRGRLRGHADGRKEYVEAFFRNLDWEHVNRQLIQAEGGAPGRAAEWRRSRRWARPDRRAPRPRTADRGRGGASVAVQGATARPW